MGESQSERDMTGAVDFAECGNRRCCRCDICAVCGFSKHKAIHGPFMGEPPGSKPYGHRFVSKDEAARARGAKG